MSYTDDGEENYKAELDAGVQAGRLATTAEERYTWLNLGHDTENDPDDEIPVGIRIDNETQRLEVLDSVIKEWERRQPGPRRAVGHAKFTEELGFVEHVRRFSNANVSIIYAQPAASLLTVVYNEHTEEEPGWRDHRASYACPRDPAWVRWCGIDEKPLKQLPFADFIEAHLEDLIAGEGFPPPVDILKLARDLNVISKGTYRRSFNPTYGTGILECKTETDTGSTVIPRAFLLGIPVFEGGARYQVEARIRFAVNENSPTFTVTMHRRAELERDAFSDVRQRVAAATSLPVLGGAP